jgi:NADPH-dependent 2,4-dienoyl-CoA reductase/sulfur reductase-like enzyme
MDHYRYLIIGGGMTADSAVRGIRQVDPQGTIGLFSAESNPPYDRPPLSKGLWKGKPLDQIWRKTAELDVELHLGQTIRALDMPAKAVDDDRGGRYSYDKLLLATGGTPRRLDFDSGQIIYYRTLEDYERLRSLADQGRRFVVVGSRFIGSEVAAALAMTGKEVVMIYPGRWIGARIFPPALSQFVSNYYQEKGVELWAEDTVVKLSPTGQQWTVHTRQGREVVADGVVAGLGITPAVELAMKAGLEVENGIKVDEFLRTTHPDVYAAGDVANFFNPALGQRLRVEHEDNANAMGLAAGRIMAGQLEPYQHLPFFYSDLFEPGYEAVGDLDPRLDLVEDWTEPNRTGVVYYLWAGRVRGVLLWNVWDQVEAARRLIAQPGPFAPADLIGRLPETSVH